MTCLEGENTSDHNSPPGPAAEGHVPVPPLPDTKQLARRTCAWVGAPPTLDRSGAAPSASSEARCLPVNPSFQLPEAGRGSIHGPARWPRSVLNAPRGAHGVPQESGSRQNQRTSALASSGPTTSAQKRHSYLLAPAVVTGDTYVPSEMGVASEMQGKPHRGPASGAWRQDSSWLTSCSLGVSRKT